MDEGLIIGFVGYLLIFLLATGIPVYIFIKAQLLKELCALLSIVLSVGLINLYFFISSKLRLISTIVLNEFHEVFWVIPPIVVYLYCLYLQRRGKRGQSTLT